MEFGEANWHEGGLWKLNSRWVGVWDLGKSNHQVGGDDEKEEQAQI